MICLYNSIEMGVSYELNHEPYVFFHIFTVCNRIAGAWKVGNLSHTLSFVLGVYKIEVIKSQG